MRRPYCIHNRIVAHCNAGRLMVVVALFSLSIYEAATSDEPRGFRIIFPVSYMRHEFLNALTPY